jgi:hypothetical protein
MQIHTDGRPILRFSLFEAWWKNPQEAMKRYFPEEEVHFSNMFMDFGSLVADELCQRPIPDWLLGAHHYDENEYRIITDVEGFMVRGTIDSYDHARRKFLDNKCVKVSRLKNGDWSAHSWTQNKVNAHEQLVFYSFLIQHVHGTVDEECSINAIPYYVDENGICRRTEYVSYDIWRVISQQERDEMKEKIVTTAKDITRLFSEYKLGYLSI